MRGWLIWGFVTCILSACGGGSSTTEQDANNADMEEAVWDSSSWNNVYWG